MLVALVAAAALASAAPTAGELIKDLGAPTKSAEASDRVRDEGEPLLLYWMMVKTAPLGVGPKVPGTFVANFRRSTQGIDHSPLESFTFLGVADAEQTKALVDALKAKGWVKGEKVVTRPGGRFRDLSLLTSDGKRGTLSLRLPSSTDNKTSAAMADGRPAPSLWLHITQS